MTLRSLPGGERPALGRLLLHDYVGHPFQVQLSRALAERGVEVLHLYNASFSTPHGRLVVEPGDPASLQIEGVRLPHMVNKQSLWRRRRDEARYARALLDRVNRYDPDVLLSANTPLDTQAALLQWSRQHDRRFVYWIQDLYGVAVRRILRKRLPLVGPLIGAYYEALERRLFRQSDHLVLISDDFRSCIPEQPGGASRTTVIENWAPLDEVPLRPRDNAWAREHDLDGKEVALYAGTLGMKHNPALLVEVAAALGDRPRAMVVVVSEGPGAEWVRAEAARRDLRNLVVLPFQPFERMPEVLAAARLLLVLLEPDAGVFSVPSKVLTYLCAGRPIVGAMPRENLAARTLIEAGAGRVVPPEDVAGFVREGLGLLADPAAADTLGAAGRAYAERTFNIAGIADRFASVLF